MSAAGTFLFLWKSYLPLRSVLDKARRMGSGDLAVGFKEELAQNHVLEVDELAEDLSTIGRRMQNTRAEAAAEGQRQAQFVSDVAHELRTPLTAMRGAAEILMDDDIPDEDRYHFCDTIVSECDRLTRLANDLLTLQRMEDSEAMTLRRVDLHDIVEHVADVLEPLLEDREVQLTISGEAPDVLGDTDRLQQVVVNLVENASRYAAQNDKGGLVHVELSGIRNHSVITVSDNGPGFGDIDPARLFDRFYRGDFGRARTQGGSGLGLAIVKAIVTAHDGTVEALNLPDGGACFIVAIPSLPPAGGAAEV